MNFFRRSARDVVRGSLALVAGIVFTTATAIPMMAQPGPGPIGPGPGCNLFPAPPSIGAAVNLSYFGPPPSETNPSLVGPVQLLKSGTVDDRKGTITLPLYRGSLKGNGSSRTVWYILTDVNDANVASFLGINYSAKLAFAGSSARTANLDDNGNLIFDQGTVDFSPERVVVPGTGGFPPQTAKPGSVGSADYSPLVRVLNAGGVSYNAPIIAFGVEASEISFANGNPDYSKVHDQVIAIDPVQGTVTLNLVNGFSFGRPVWYHDCARLQPLVGGATVRMDGQRDRQRFPRAAQRGVSDPDPGAGRHPDGSWRRKVWDRQFRRQLPDCAAAELVFPQLGKGPRMSRLRLRGPSHRLLAQNSFTIPNRLRKFASLRVPCGASRRLIGFALAVSANE